MAVIYDAGKRSPCFVLRAFRSVSVRDTLSKYWLSWELLVFSGGGYFRLIPYPLIKKWTKEHSEYMMAYIHPRDLDAHQPVLEGLSLSRRCKSYVGLKSAENKLSRYLTDFEFTDVSTADGMIDWSEAPVIHI